MKSIYTLAAGLLLAAAATTAFAQQQKGAWLSTDRVVTGTAGDVYKDARISVGSDGAIYTGRIEKPAGASTYNTFRVLKSRDTGRTWTSIYTGSLGANIKCTAMDVLAVGTGADYKLLVARAYSDTTLSSTPHTLYLYRVDTSGANGVSLVNDTYTYGNNRGYVSLSLASDYRDKNGNAAPYSYSLVAGKGHLYDSIIAFTSNTTGTMVRKSAYGTYNFIRKVSASIGSANGAISMYGRLGMAWDEFASNTTPFGGIKTMFVYPVDGSLPAYGGPFRIGSDSVSYRNPCVVLSQNTASTTSRAMVMYEITLGTYTGVRYRVDSVMNLTAAPTFSSLVDVETSSAQSARQPHAMYDPVYDNYLMTYYDSATGAIPYKVISAATVFNGTPATVKANYRDASGLVAGATVAPRVDINTIPAQAAFVWNDGGATMFDAEYGVMPTAVTGVMTLEDFRVFPNPSAGLVRIRFSAAAGSDGALTVYDVTGRTVYTKDLHISPGNNEAEAALNDLPNGTYRLLCRGADFSATSQIVILH